MSNTSILSQQWRTPNSIVSHIRAPRVELTPKKIDGRSFGDVYQENINKQKEITFSQSAINKMKVMELELDQDDLQKLSQAVDKMMEKGSQESLIMMDGNAFILDIHSRTVLNVLNHSNEQEAGFKNIDSAMIVNSRAVL